MWSEQGECCEGAGEEEEGEELRLMNEFSCVRKVIHKNEDLPPSQVSDLHYLTIHWSLRYLKKVINKSEVTVMDQRRLTTSLLDTAHCYRTFSLSCFHFCQILCPFLLLESLSDVFVGATCWHVGVGVWLMRGPGGRSNIRQVSCPVPGPAIITYQCSTWSSNDFHRKGKASLF